LGLRAYASDLNPVAVLINKALIEIPPKFAGMPPVHPRDETTNVHEFSRKGKGKQGELWKKEWKGAEGLAADVRYYGKWMRDEAEKRIGNFYPKFKITPKALEGRPDLIEQGFRSGDKLTIIAWLWARSVMCLNPACKVEMPLVRSFALSTKKSNRAWIEPIVEELPEGKQISFTLQIGIGKPKEGTVNRSGAMCLACKRPIPFEYIREEGKKGSLNTKLLAIVAEGSRGRVYFNATRWHSEIAKSATPSWNPETDLPEQALGFRVQLYGMAKHSDLFTNRQLIALTTFADLVVEVREKVLIDFEIFTKYRAGIAQDQVHYAQSYANAIATYLGMAVSRQSNRMSTICFWDTGGENVQQVFARQALPMTWDFAEANPFCNSTGSWLNAFDYICINLERLPENVVTGSANQIDAVSLQQLSYEPVISTDPPYYDNIGYADLSDYFYVWLRHSLNKIYPYLFATVLVPKKTELIASPFRFGGSKEEANQFFESGLQKVFTNLYMAGNHQYPITIFYAFKQSEVKENDERVSTGWETMLDGLLNSGFLINGTWPMRTEQPGGLRVVGQNSLASSIVLVCRKRNHENQTVTRRDFVATLKRELQPSLRQLQQGAVAPVDFAQSSIGPGMAIFSQHKQVLEADGSPMSVRTALALINQALDEFLAEQEGEYDADTRWALAWYEQYGFNEGPFGVAETLSKAKNTSVGGLQEAGVLVARAGKVRMLSRTELKEEWDPSQDKRPTAWEAVQYLIRALDTHGEQVAAQLLSRLGGLGETARDLAYRLYTICERKGWAQDALGYNMLVVAWPRLKEMASKAHEAEQGRLI
jgi:putative DNA methylase